MDVRFRIGSDGATVDETGLKFDLNDFDAWAVEAALQLREKAGAGDRYGNIFVDTEKSHEAYKEWLAMTRPAPGPDGLRRPLWFDRPLRPVADAYKL